MKKIILILSIFISLIGYSQVGVNPVNVWNLNGNTFATSANWLGTKNAQNLVFKTNNSTVATFSTNGGATLGTGTVGVNTTSLGIFRVKQGSSFLDFGEYSAGVSGIWGGASTSTNSASNYNILFGSNAEFNASSSIALSLGSSAKISISSTGIKNALPTRIGSLTAPSATLDVTGTMSVSGTSTLTGIVTTSNITSTGNLTMNGLSNCNLNTNGVNRLNAYSNGVAISGILTTTGACTLNAVRVSSILATAIPTSSTGLTTGAIYSNAGVLMIVP